MMTFSRTMMCLTLAVLAMSAMAEQTTGRQLLKKGKDKYSAALAPLPGSNAAGSGNCSVKWTQSKDKLKVKVYLLGQTQTTGISLNQVIASIPGESAAPQFDLRQGSPTGANIVALYNGPAVSPNGLFDGLINNGTIVAADLMGPLAGKAPGDLQNAIATGSPGIFCVTSTSTSPAALSGQLAKGGKNGKASSTAAAGR